MRGGFLLLALLLAGCASVPAGPRWSVEATGASGPRGADDVWVVWAHGREGTTRGPYEPVAMCSIVFDHALDPAARTLTLSSSYAKPAGAVVLVYDHFDDGDCPLAYRVSDNATDQQPMGKHGVLSIQVGEDGSVTADGHSARLGERHRFDYDEGRARGGFWVENLGAWPRSAIGASQ